jgi:hypothetical protein
LCSFLYTYRISVGISEASSTVFWLIKVLAPIALAALLSKSYIIGRVKNRLDANGVSHESLVSPTTVFDLSRRFTGPMVGYVWLTMTTYWIHRYVPPRVPATALSPRQFSELWYPEIITAHTASEGYQKICEAKIINFVGTFSSTFIVHYAQLGALTLILFWILTALYETIYPLGQMIWLSIRTSRRNQNQCY